MSVSAGGGACALKPTAASMMPVNDAMIGRIAVSCDVAPRQSRRPGLYDQTSRVDSGPMEPWQQYLEALKERAVRIPDAAFGRGEMMAEAAHDAYQRTANQLTANGWDEESALMVTRLFG